MGLSRCFVILVTLLLLTGCGGGGSTVPYTPPAPTYPNVAGSWVFTQVITQDGSGYFGEGFTDVRAALVSQSGANITYLLDSGTTGTGSLSGSNFSLVEDGEFAIDGTVYATHAESSGTASSTRMTGTGYEDFAVAVGDDILGIDGARIYFNFAGVKQ